MQLQQQQRLHELLAKEHKSKQELVDLLTTLRKNSFRCPDAALEYSHQLLTKHAPGDQQPLYLDIYSHAALDLQTPSQKTTMSALQRFKKMIGSSRFVQRLEAVIRYLTPAQRKESYPHLRAIYESMLRADLTDADTRKKAICLLKCENRLDDYVDRLNTYLEENPSDQETWQELGQLYTEKLNYAKAAFCYEELILLKPQNDHFFVRLAELYYTLGGQKNLNVAKDYFSYVVARDQKNYRALWGLNRTTRTLVQQHEKECSETVKQLYQTTSDVLKKLYSQRKNKGVSIDKIKF